MMCMYLLFKPAVPNVFGPMTPSDILGQYRDPQNKKIKKTARFIKTRLPILNGMAEIALQPSGDQNEDECSTGSTSCQRRSQAYCVPSFSELPWLRIQPHTVTAIG